MYTTMELGGKRVELTSNAATPRLFQKIFGKDLLVEFSKIDLSDVKGEKALGVLDTLKSLAFVLNMQATKPFRECYSKLTEFEYLEWLGQFEEEDFYDPQALIDIVKAWQKSAVTSVEAKNEDSPQSES
jgi:hypothetical protein